MEAVLPIWVLQSQGSAKAPPPDAVAPIYPTSVFIYLVLSVLAVLLFPRGMQLFSLVFGPYLVTNLIASLLTASQKGWKHLPLLPLCFAILHLSYGFGFLIGLVKFWNCWGDWKGKAADFKPAPAD